MHICPKCKNTASFLLDDCIRKCSYCGTIYYGLAERSAADILFHEKWADYSCEITDPLTGVKQKGAITKCDLGQLYFRPDYYRPPWVEIPLSHITKCETLREELAQKKVAEAAKPIQEMTLQELIKNDS